MFGLFGKNDKVCPIPEETRKWIDLVFLWFFDSFGKEKIAGRRVLVPNFTDFPVNYTGSEENARQTLEFVVTYENNYGSWGFSNTGYLSQSEWGYALALFAYIKNDIRPAWLKYLSKDVFAAFNKSIRFIQDNTSIVLNAV
jgi:hypothetical protein